MLLSGLIDALPSSTSTVQPLGADLRAPDPVSPSSTLPVLDAGQGTPDFYADLAAAAPIAVSTIAAGHGVGVAAAAAAPIATSSIAGAHGAAVSLAAVAPIAASSLAAAHGVGVALAASAPVASSSCSAAHGVVVSSAATAPVAASSISAAVAVTATADIAAIAPIGAAFGLASSWGGFVSPPLAPPAQVGGWLMATAPCATSSASVTVRVLGESLAPTPRTVSEILVTHAPWESVSIKEARLVLELRR